MGCPYNVQFYYLLSLFLMYISLPTTSNCLYYNHPLHAQYFLFYFPFSFTRPFFQPRNVLVNLDFFNISSLAIIFFCSACGKNGKGFMDSFCTYNNFSVDCSFLSFFVPFYIIIIHMYYAVCSVGVILN